MSMATIVRKICRTEIDRLWTTAIARVDAVYREEGRVRITMKDTINGETITLPSVPVVMPKHGNSAILMPISVGDTVVVAFMKTSTSGSLRDGDIHPGLRQQWTLKNAVVIATVPLDIELGEVIVADPTFDENYVIPEKGIHIVSDEGIRLLSPCIDIPIPVLFGVEYLEDSTTSLTYVQAWRFNFNAEAKPYLIRLRFETYNSSSWGTQVRIQIDDTTTIFEDEIITGSYVPISYWYVWLNPGAGAQEEEEEELHTSGIRVYV